jgi:hypothetical protein
MAENQSNEPRPPFQYLKKACIGAIAGPMVAFVFFCVVIVDSFGRLAPGRANEPEGLLMWIAVVLVWLGIGVAVVSALYILWWLIS